MKQCTICEVEYEATTENFPTDKSTKCGLDSRCLTCGRARGRKYYQANREVRLAISKKYNAGNRIELQEYQRKYYATVEGYLHHAHLHMVSRCKNIKSYIRKGIQCNFISANDLISYIVDILQIDPRGKQVHRIDNDGHYEPGNIEFLTQEEHSERHRLLLIRGTSGNYAK